MGSKYTGCFGLQPHQNTRTDPLLFRSSTNSPPHTSISHANTCPHGSQCIPSSRSDIPRAPWVQLQGHQPGTTADWILALFNPTTPPAGEAVARTSACHSLQLTHLIALTPNSYSCTSTTARISFFCLLSKGLGYSLKLSHGCAHVAKQPCH